MNHMSKKNGRRFFPALRALILLAALLLSGCGSSAAPALEPAPAETPVVHQHEWGGWITETPADCETPGVEVRTCILDPSHEERREIPALGHDWADATFTLPMTCTRCGATSGDPAPESTFPTREEILYLFDHNYHTTVSTKGVSLTLPADSYYLDTPYRTWIKASKAGGSVYIMPIPKEGNGNLGTIADGTEVVIVAKQGAYFFFIAYDGRMGWNGGPYFGDR